MSLRDCGLRTLAERLESTLSDGLGGCAIDPDFAGSKPSIFNTLAVFAKILVHLLASDHRGR